MPVVVPGTPGANGGRVTVPAQAREELKPGIMVARIAQSVAIGGFDQRAAANAAEGLYGTEMGQIVANMRSEEHTSELQSLMRISYAVFCLKKKKTQTIRSTRQVSLTQQQYED